MSESKPALSMVGTDVGLAPRTLDPERRRVLDRLPQNRFVLWVILAILFSIHLPFLLTMDLEMGLGVWIQLLALPGLFTFLAVRAFLERKAARQRYYDVYTEGAVVVARVGNMHIYQVRGAQRCSIEFHLQHNGKQARIDTWDTSVDLLSPNMDIEVLWYERHPDVVIPTIILP